MIRPTTFAPLVLALAAIVCNRKAATAADPFDPRAAIRTTIETVDRVHIAPKPLDDRLSKQWFDAFLLRLDSRRTYFLQSDLRDFEPFVQRLDDLARTGSFEFAEHARERLRLRVEAAMKCAQQYVAEPLNLTTDDVIPASWNAYAADADDLQERWRLRIKLERLIEKTYGRAAGDVQEQLTERYRRLLKQAREMNDERLCQHYLDAFLSAYDPHADYLSPEWNALYTSGIEKTYRIGLGFPEQEGRFLLKLPPSHPRKSSLRRFEGSQLLAIRRLDGRLYDVVEMPREDLVTMIRYASGPLENDDEIVLEMLNPTTQERFAVRCPRW